MALEFGLGRRDKDTEKCMAWQKRWDLLQDGDKAFALNSLPFILMFSDIGIVTEESIPHITGRLQVGNPEISEDIKNQLKEYNISFEEYLKRFIGFSANVSTLTSTEFIKNVIFKIKQRTPALSKDQINKIDYTPDVYSLPSL
jgi:hypothetical protein